jgi:hypothetical protein
MVESTIHFTQKLQQTLPPNFLDFQELIFRTTGVAWMNLNVWVWREADLHPITSEEVYDDVIATSSPLQIYANSEKVVNLHAELSSMQNKVVEQAKAIYNLQRTLEDVR